MPFSKSLFDPISVVECAYDLRSPRQEWLQRLHHLIAPAMGYERGVFMAEIEVSGTSPEDWAAHTRESLDADSTEYFATLAASMRSELIGPLLLYAPSVGTIGGLVRQGTIDQSVVEEDVRPATGATDIFALFPWTPGSTRGLVIAAPSSKPYEVSNASLTRWKQVTSHLAAGYRLRRALEAEPEPGDIPPGGAILDPRGKVLDALGEASTPSGRAALGRAAQCQHAARGSARKTKGLDLWQPLVSGRWSLVDHFDRDGRHFVVAHVNADDQSDPRALSRRERQVARRLVRGDSQKEIGYDLGLSPSTVGNHVTTIGRKLGTSSQWETTNVLTALLRRPSEAVSVGDVALRVWETTRETPAQLTPSEADVYQSLLSGASNEQIARKRGTSTRTVAHQVAAIFSKLGVRSRQQLLATAGAKRRKA